MTFSLLEKLEIWLVLLLAASATAVVVKWIRIPYSVALVIAGLVIGQLEILPPVALRPELVMFIFLPALLFEASYNLDLKILRRNWKAVSVLATIGVVACMAGVAALLHVAGGMQLETTLLVGAMLAGTDPVAVVALFRAMNIDKRLTVILEGESLFNDGTAVVLFKIFLAMVVSGAHFSLTNTIGSFFLVVCGGILLGVAIGFIASRLTSVLDDHMLETTLTLVTAYGTYIVAERLHVSEVIAVVVAGIILGNYGSRNGMSASTRLAVHSFWEYVTFFVNSILFLLIGMQIKLPVLLAHANLIGLGLVAVLVTRLLSVHVICQLVSTARLPIPLSWRHLLFWGGLRGALGMALALSLPLTFADRELVINVVFGIVLLTLLVPGLTMGTLVRLMDMNQKDGKATKYQEYKGLLSAYSQELADLTQLREESRISSSGYQVWNEHIRNKIDATDQNIKSLKLSDSSIDEMQDRQAKIHLLEGRRAYLDKLVRTGTLPQESAHHLFVALDCELDAISSGSQTEDTQEKIQI